MRAFKSKKEVPFFALVRFTLSIVMTMLQSCSVLGTKHEASFQDEKTSRPAQVSSVLSPNSINEIPVFSDADFVEQQNLIDEINRQGQPFTYSGFAEQVPVPLNIEITNSQEASITNQVSFTA